MNDLRLLRTFIEVAQNGSMADAAVVRGCSSAAISQQIARLESEMGVRLLDRHREGVTVTPAGSVLVQKATALISVTVDMQRAVQDAADPEIGNLRLTAFSSACVRMLPAVLKQIRKELPRLKLNLVGRYDDQHPFNTLLQGETDVLVFHEYDYVPQPIPEDVEVCILGRDIIDAVLPRTHRMARRRKLKLSDLQHDDWVMFHRNNIATQSILHACRTVGFTPNIAFDADDYQVVLSLVAGACGVSAQPRLATHRHGASVVVRPFQEDVLGRTIGIAWRRDGNSHALETLVEAFQRQFTA